jgi:hypothetical protein
MDSLPVPQERVITSDDVISTSSGSSAVRIVPLSILDELEAGRTCRQAQVVRRLYPDGIPLTLAAARTLQAAGVDVVRGVVHLLTDEQRIEFLLFTLRQRQQSVANLLDMAGLPGHAKTVRALVMATPEDASRAVPVYEAARAAAWAAARAAARDAAWDAARAAARDAAWDAAWDAAGGATGGAAGGAAWDAARDEQIRWIAKEIGVEDTES